jgi:hypothetical protein
MRQRARKEGMRDRENRKRKKATREGEEGEKNKRKTGLKGHEYVGKDLKRKRQE